jgi:hypothetical protein
VGLIHVGGDRHDCTGTYKSDYRTITTAPYKNMMLIYTYKKKCKKKFSEEEKVAKLKNSINQKL